MINKPRFKVAFYRSPNGKEPVREWLKSLLDQDKKVIGEDIKTVQFGWPMGMPLVRKLEPELWEVRSDTSPGVAQIIFTAGVEYLILLHGFIKKSRKTPRDDLALARRRLAKVRGD